MSSLLEKMLKTGSTKSSAVLSASPFFNSKEAIPTDLPILNIAFSGSLDGGLLPGLTVVAGASKSFKTMLSLYCMKAYLEKHPEGIALLYDSEFGITPDYIKSFNIDIDRVVHIPIKDVEELKFDIVQKLDAVDKKDRVFIMIDSIGNLASKKELEDAQNEKSVADMSRAKSLKSLFRIITPYLTTKSIPCLAINHVYNELGLYPKAIVSGGCVLAGTEIQTPDGLKNVEEFEPGDLVNTLSGPMPVTHVWDPETLEEGTPTCYEITFEDGYTVTVSDKHKFLIDGKWVEAKDLAEDALCTTTSGSLCITTINLVGRKPVYDLSVQEVEHYVLKNGVVTHNTGIYYSANQIFIISKSQEKEGTELAGWKFTINIEKSRYVKEKAKLPFTVMYDSGIQKWSSLFDLAMEAGYIIKPKMGWYQLVDPETGEISEKSYREAAVKTNEEFFNVLIENSDFKTFIERKFKLSADKLNSELETDEEDIDIDE
jgi:hypothetical protein